MSKINMDLIRSKLAKLEGKKPSENRTNTSYFWKPKEGSTKVRIIPIKDHPSEIPFFEAYFHYLPWRQTLLSPLTFGESDLMADFANETLNEVYESGERLPTEEFKKIVKLRPQLRTFALVIVRGEENLGPRWFGFGKTNYEKLLRTIADPEYGNITDPINGRDITIDHTPKEKSKTNFSSTEITISPVQKPIHDDEEYIKKVLNNQPSVKDSFIPATNDELKEALERYSSNFSETEESNDDSGGSDWNFDKKSSTNKISTEDETNSSDEEDADDKPPVKETKSFDVKDFDKIFNS